MEISEKTINALEKIITGNSILRDKSLSPYRVGWKLVEFFNQFGEKDEYGKGFPPRHEYVKRKLNEHNATSKMSLIIETALDPRHFLGTVFDVQEAVAYINEFLRFDGFEIRKIGEFYKVYEIGKALVDANTPFDASGVPNQNYIVEQMDKCEQKILQGDYDGAITNARSLLEAVFLEMEELLVGERKEYDGNLNKLYKRVQKLLNLEPSRPDISNSLREILSGLISIVSGVGSVRNKMSDAHARSYKPEKHHAHLAVNAARTVVGFIFDTFEYQLKSGAITISNKFDDKS